MTVIELIALLASEYDPGATVTVWHPYNDKETENVLVEKSGDNVLIST